MAITINIYYTGKGTNALKFAKEMIESGIVKRIRETQGNLRYEYFIPFDHNKTDVSTVLLIDSWENQSALDKHHDSEVMDEILKLREKYDLKMRVERFIRDDESITEKDKEFIKS